MLFCTASVEKRCAAKNLSGLGAECLAELVLEPPPDDTAMKRRMRLETASRSGGGDVAVEIRKRFVTIAKARSFGDRAAINLSRLPRDVTRGLKPCLSKAI